MVVLDKRAPLAVHLGIHVILVGSYASVNQMTPVLLTGQSACQVMDDTCKGHGVHRNSGVAARVTFQTLLRRGEYVGGIA